MCIKENGRRCGLENKEFLDGLAFFFLFRKSVCGPLRFRVDVSSSARELVQHFERKNGLILLCMYIIIDQSVSIWQMINFIVNLPFPVATHPIMLESNHSVAPPPRYWGAILLMLLPVLAVSGIPSYHFELARSLENDTAHGQVRITTILLLILLVILLPVAVLHRRIGNGDWFSVYDNGRWLSVIRTSLMLLLYLRKNVIRSLIVRPTSGNGNGGGRCVRHVDRVTVTVAIAIAICRSSRRTVHIFHAHQLHQFRRIVNSICIDGTLERCRGLSAGRAGIPHAFQFHDSVRLVVSKY
jgi:hypothetical protein